MDHEDDVQPVRSKRIYRSLAEKRRIVELTFRSGLSVPKVAQAEGVNSHQIFDWRRAYLRGWLDPKEQKPATLMPVVLSPVEASAASVDSVATEKVTAVSAPERPGSSIHIDLPGRAKIRVESGVDAALLRTVLEMLRP